jgi:hypothetical protein
MEVVFSASSMASAGKSGLRGLSPRSAAVQSTGTGTLRSFVRCAIRSTEQRAASRLFFERGSKKRMTSCSTVFGNNGRIVEELLHGFDVRPRRRGPNQAGVADPFRERRCAEPLPAGTQRSKKSTVRSSNLPKGGRTASVKLSLACSKMPLAWLIVLKPSYP